jgi:glycosyltransferase involved in cell wall biosynthesis
VPPRGGSTRSNLAFLKLLADHGHGVRVIAAAAEARTPEQQLELWREMNEQELGTLDTAVDDGRFHDLGGIEVLSVRDLVRNLRVLHEQLVAFEPDWVLVSSEDVGHTLLKEAFRIAPERLIYLAHTPQFFPGGPASWNPDQAGVAAVRSAPAVITISKAMAAYLKQHLGVHATVIHPPIYGHGSFPALGDFDNGCLGMVNPCAVKGISVFFSIADRLPNEKFAVLPGWGTTHHDLAQLAARPNVVIAPRVRKIENFLEKLKILLMPSLWLEGFGLITMEAMLRGVPVIASDSSGLREAKAGTRFLIPVNLIEQYQTAFDERSLPKPVVPHQNIEPWIAAVRSLVSSRAGYEAEVERQQSMARTFVSNLDASAIEHFLTNLVKPAASLPDRARPLEAVFETLSGAKRLLLLKRLTEQQTKRD